MSAAAAESVGQQHATGQPLWSSTSWVFIPKQIKQSLLYKLSRGNAPSVLVFGKVGPPSASSWEKFCTVCVEPESDWGVWTSIQANHQNLIFFAVFDVVFFVKRRFRRPSSVGECVLQLSSSQENELLNIFGGATQSKNHDYEVRQNLLFCELCQ